ncbi:hypothetical protein PP7435_CHR3-0389 [Komagataella phaffii CBS 7435]|uniref:Uncharacterized protein n=1 Tax=Komagataella phaffii (strain ATCC 76273 / CBS 7435 / CECT 11047 / NRRL Y-11430 / Wegner 21-1) TaxID=981350 RepID=F2QVC6_KOMPC|nr:GQ67_03904T0 [Komagataella phaffii]AOA69253.1 GQ68_03878T0 [Komagataella phaffii GS115]CAH2449353.1 hypothetical protein BQ9382_C3-2110 [Komagataella phaffii CBS 7435]CCA39354.1 hypothetical protein PP7435_CHR3-0389 [Komagataella phaffii CBS 7435]
MDQYRIFIGLTTAVLIWCKVVPWLIGFIIPSISIRSFYFSSVSGIEIETSSFSLTIEHFKFNLLNKQSKLFELYGVKVHRKKLPPGSVKQSSVPTKEKNGSLLKKYVPVVSKFLSRSKAFNSIRLIGLTFNDDAGNELTVEKIRLYFANDHGGFIVRFLLDDGSLNGDLFKSNTIILEANSTVDFELSGFRLYLMNIGVDLDRIPLSKGKTSGKDESKSSSKSNPLSFISKLKNFNVQLDNVRIHKSGLIFSVEQITTTVYDSHVLNENYLYELLLSYTSVEVEYHDKLKNIDLPRLFYVPFGNILSTVNFSKPLFECLSLNDPNSIKALQNAFTINNLRIRLPLLQLNAIQQMLKSTDSYETDAEHSSKKELEPLFSILARTSFNILLLKTQVDVILFDDISMGFKVASISYTLDTQDLSNSNILPMLLKIRHIAANIKTNSEVIPILDLNKLNSEFSLSLSDKLFTPKVDTFIGTVKLQLSNISHLRYVALLFHKLDLTSTTNFASLSKPPKNTSVLFVNLFCFQVCSLSITVGATGILPSFKIEGNEKDLSDYHHGLTLCFTKLMLTVGSGLQKLSINSLTSHISNNEAKKKFLIVDKILVKKSSARTVLVVSSIDSLMTIEHVWVLLLLARASICFVKEIIPTKKRNPDVDKSVEISSKSAAIEIQVGTVLVLFSLPYDEKLLCAFDLVQIVKKQDEPDFSMSAFTMRLFVPNPLVMESWISIVQLKENFISTCFKEEDQPLVTIETSSVDISVPEYFLVYKLLDNAVNFFKSALQINLNFKGFELDDFKLKLLEMPKLLPHPKKPLRMPKVRLKSKAFGLFLLDDPFEAEITIIYKIGLMESRSRILKMKKYEEMRNQLWSEFNSKCERERREFEELGNSHDEDSQANINQVNEALELESRLEKIKMKLLANISKSWIDRISKCKRDREKSASSKMYQFNVNSSEVSNELLERYNIMSSPSMLPLFALAFAELDLVIGKPKGFELDDYADFLYKTGKGIPLDTQYSTLIPLNIDLKSSNISIRLRDFPLPMLLLDCDEDDPIQIEGDCIIGEQMNTPDEFRWVKVPFVEELKCDIVSDSAYGIKVPRTLTNIKTYTNLKVKVNSNRPSILTWGKSHQPALSYAMSIFEVFTKPPIDISPKIGFWDKMRLSLHGMVDFDFKGDLSLIIKGSLSPYSLVGSGAGFAFTWSKNVNLKINHSPLPEELVVVTSKEFKIGVPNFAIVQCDEWSNRLSRRSTPFTFDKVIIKMSSDEVKWNWGLMFEQEADSSFYSIPGFKQRTTVFKPHYEVRLKHPSFFKNKSEKIDWDAYHGFRSKYTHMAISVESSRGEKVYNSVHLSPVAFAHFFEWWGLFHNSISTRTRENTILGTSNGKVTANANTRLMTIKYQMILKPLYISHVYRHTDSEDLKSKNKVAFTGLKAHVESFTMDLHQRKEETRILNEILNFCKRDWHFKMYQGELDFTETYIKVISAVFNENALESYVASSLGLQKSNSFNIPGPAEPNPCNEENINSSWVDDDDFIELHAPELTSNKPRLKMITVAYSPRFSYFRQLRTSNEVEYPFGQERSHNCLIGQNHPEYTQEELARERAKEFEEHIRCNEEKLMELGKLPSHDPRLVLDLVEKNRSFKQRLETIQGMIMDLEDLCVHQYQCTDDTQLTPTSTSKSIFRDMMDTSNVNISSTFNNRFIIHNMNLKWNEEIRDLILQYIYRIEDRLSAVFDLSRKAVKLAEEFMNNSFPTEAKHSEAEEFMDAPFEVCDEKLAHFESILRALNDDEQSYTDQYLFKIISPQIQLTSVKDLDNCVLVTSRDISLSVVTILGSDSTEVGFNAAYDIVERRYGIQLEEALYYVLNKQKFYDKDYGYFHFEEGTSWPPFLGFEMCYDGSPLKSGLVVEKTSIALICWKPNPLHFDKESRATKRDTIKVWFPTLTVNATSTQYYAVYTIVNKVFLHVDYERSKTQNRLRNTLAFNSDFEGLGQVDNRVNNLQREIAMLKNLKLYMNLIKSLLPQQDRDKVLWLNIENKRLSLELFYLMQVVKDLTGPNKSSSEGRNFFIFTDQLIIHLLDEDAKPFVDVGIASSYFVRSQSTNGANNSKIVIHLIQAFNLRKGARYPEALAPLIGNEVSDLPNCKEAEPMFLITWRMGKPVGQITVIEKFEFEIQPLKIQVDHTTARQVYTFVYPGTEDSAEEDEEDAINDDQDSDIPDSASILSSAASIESSKSGNSKPKKGSILSFLKKKGNGLKNDSHSSVSSLLDSPSTIRSSSMDLSPRSSEIGSRIDLTGSDVDHGVSQMLKRSAEYAVINKAEIRPTTLSISFKGTGALALADVENLTIKIPKLTYFNKLWSSEEFFLNFKKDVVKVVFNHTGKIIGNKLSSHKHSKPLEKTLPQLSNFETYVPIEDLQEKIITDENTRHNMEASNRGLEIRGKRRIKPLGPELLEPVIRPSPNHKHSNT